MPSELLTHLFPQPGTALLEYQEYRHHHSEDAVTMRDEQYNQFWEALLMIPTHLLSQSGIRHREYGERLLHGTESQPASAKQRTADLAAIEKLSEQDDTYKQIVLEIRKQRESAAELPEDTSNSVLLYAGISAEAAQAAETPSTESLLGRRAALQSALGSSVSTTIGFERSCKHDWKTTHGLFSVWHDCRVCGVRREETDS